MKGVSPRGRRRLYGPLGVREVLEISFKQTIDLVVSMSESYRPLAGKPWKLRERHQILIEEVSQRVLEIRPYRLELRAIKRHPESYPLLTAPRRAFVEKDTRSNAYKKNPKRRLSLFHSRQATKRRRWWLPHHSRKFSLPS